MTPGLPDPATSRAVLVGVSRYSRMAADRQLPAVENNLRRLAALLSDPRIWGLPEIHCRVLHQPDDADTVIEALREAAEQAEDTLLFYYAGHGLTDPLVDDSGLYLALPRAHEPGGTHLALHYNQVRAKLRLAPAVRRVVVLDCCWSGRALGAAMGGADFAAAAQIESTAVLTASAATAQALAPVGEDLTAFTGALTDLLDGGVPDGPALLDVVTLYRLLHGRLAGAGRPLPQLGGSGAEVVFAKNTAWSAPADAPASGPGSRQSSAPVSAPIARRRMVDLQRTGHYEEAREARLRTAESGDPDSIRELAAELRRKGDYMLADELEGAAAAPDDGTLRELLHRFRG
jgi:hypothetical protein